MAETQQTPALTQRGLEVLQALWDFTRKRGYPPTIRELAAALGIASSQGVYDHIRRLQGRGLVTRPPRGQARGLQLTPAGWAALGAAPPGGGDLDGLAEILRAIVAERQRQDEKWGQQDHADHDPRLAGRDERRLAEEYEIPTVARAKALCEMAFLGKTGGCWPPILVEELAEAVFAPTEEEREVELVQLAALCVQWIQAIRRRRGSR